MGEDADFFDGSVADRRLVEKLRTMENPPAERHAGA